MGCPSEAEINSDIVFSVNTHNPNLSGTVQDADGVPTYDIYEDDSSVFIVSGSMAKHDNKTGFYLKKENLISGTYSNGKNYTINIEATVDSIPASKSYTFKAYDARKSNLIYVGGDIQSGIDLKDFVDTGYDPSVNKVEGVKLVDTTTTNTDMRGTDGANTTVPDVAGTAASLHAITDAKVDITITGTQNIQSRVPTALVNGRMDSDMTAISGDSVAADNVEATYDGTGYDNAVAPAQQGQISNIAIGSSSLSTIADSAVITTGSQVNTYTASQERDGVYHQLSDSGGVSDMYYEFDVGVVGIPTSVTIYGRSTGLNDDIGVYGWNWTTSSWNQIGIIEGSALDSEHQFSTYNNHVGTGVNAGTVRIRFYGTGLTTAIFYIDQAYISYTNIQSPVGYANGCIWIDTINGTAGTVQGVNGVADNPVDSWADALTLNASLMLNRFCIAGGSSITLTGDSSYYQFIGSGYTLALGGQNISSTYIEGATVSGISSGSDSKFSECKLDAVTIGPSCFECCGIGVNSGQVTAGSSGEYVFKDCFSMVPGSGVPVFDFSGLGASTGINIRGWLGGASFTLDSDCTISHEVLAGGGQTFTTGGADIELRGLFRSSTFILSGSGTVQQIGITGVITISGTATTTVNLYGISTSLSDSSSGTTVNDYTTSSTNVNTIASDVSGLNGDAMRGTDGAALSGTALSNTIWTNARAGYIDELYADNIPSDIDILLLRLQGTIDVGTHKPQSGDSYPVITGINGITNILSTMYENVSGYRWTQKSLEQAPGGGTGGDASSANQITIINEITGMKGSTFTNETLVAIKNVIDTTDGKILGTIAVGTHQPQSGDSYPIVSNSTYGNEAIKTICNNIAAAVGAGGVTTGSKNIRLCQVLYDSEYYDVAIAVNTLDEVNDIINQWALDQFGILSGGQTVLSPALDLPEALVYNKNLSDVITTLDPNTTLDFDNFVYEVTT